MSNKGISYRDVINQIACVTKVSVERNKCLAELRDDSVPQLSTFNRLVNATEAYHTECDKLEEIRKSWNSL
jgi:hypothetical protein